MTSAAQGILPERGRMHDSMASSWPAVDDDVEENLLGSGVPPVLPWGCRSQQEEDSHLR